MTNLAEYTYEIYETRNQKKTIDSIYFDFSKAVDRIDHGIMAKQLAELSCPYNFFKLIMKFITHRKYSLNIDGKDTGSYFEPNTGVPQGSHCGPLLFIIYINNLQKILNVKYKVYADDIKIYHEKNNQHDASKLQRNINNIEKWAESLKLALNPKKTHHIRFGAETYASSYFLGTTPITRVEIVKDLGLYVDDKMTFKYHINNIYLKLSRMLGAARRITKETGNPPLLVKIYNIFMRPILEYADVIWNKENKKEIKKLEKINRTITAELLQHKIHYIGPHGTKPMNKD